MSSIENIDLVNELLTLSMELPKRIEQLQRYGIELAKKEATYKVKLNERALALRESGIAVTLIDKVIYGEKEVAKLRYERDVAQVMYETALEGINGAKLQIRILQNQVDKEWSTSEH